MDSTFVHCISCTESDLAVFLGFEAYLEANERMEEEKCRIVSGTSGGRRIVHT